MSLLKVFAACAALNPAKRKHVSVNERRSRLVAIRTVSLADAATRLSAMFWCRLVAARDLRLMDKLTAMFLPSISAAEECEVDAVAADKERARAGPDDISNHRRELAADNDVLKEQEDFDFFI